MAFVSVRELRIKHPGKKCDRPNVVINHGTKGSTTCSFNRSSPFMSSHIEFEIDGEAKAIRVRKCSDGISVNKGGRCSMSKSIVLMTGKKKIYITEGDDGWWYGSYA